MTTVSSSQRAVGGPLVVASGNGHLFRNGGTKTCVEEVCERLARGEDVLDAIVAGVQIVELDPADDSVGYGGLPNADGIVQLDSSVMHGTLRRAGAVACLEACVHPQRLRAQSPITRIITCWSARVRRRLRNRWATPSKAI